MPNIAHMGDVVVLRPEGDINHREMAAVKNAITEVLRVRESRVVLDLGGVDHVNYMTVGVLVERAGRLRRSGGDLRLAGLSGYLEDILRFSGVHHLFAAYDTVSEAVASFAGEAMRTPKAVSAGTRGSWVPQMH